MKAITDTEKTLLIEKKKACAILRSHTFRTISQLALQIMFLGFGTLFDSIAFLVKATLLHKFPRMC